MDENTIEIIDKATDLIFLSLALIQLVSSKTPEEVLEAIKAEGQKTDELLAKLR
jgi:hypothetical protein